MINEFTIDRSMWLRGREPGGSYLLREIDGKRCCLGFYLEACGVPDDQLRGYAAPGSVYRNRAEYRDLVPKWLIGPPWHRLSDDPADAVNSITAQYLMEVNDATDSTDAEREALIAKTFADHGVEVHFV